MTPWEGEEKEKERDMGKIQSFDVTNGARIRFADYAIIIVAAVAYLIFC